MFKKILLINGCNSKVKRLKRVILAVFRLAVNTFSAFYGYCCKISIRRLNSAVCKLYRRLVVQTSQLNYRARHC